MKTEDSKYKDYLWKDKSILRHLYNDEINYLKEMAEIKFFKKNDVIFAHGKRISGCYIVLSGIVKQYKTGFEGKDYIIRLAIPYEIIGYRSVLNDETACHTSTAIEDCALCFIPTECLRYLVKTNGNFALDLIQIACRELEESHLLITEITQKSSKERLVELLLSLKKKFGVDRYGTLNISLSRKELATIVGAATESVIRLLSELKAERCIEVSGKKITILDENSLKRIATV